MILSRTLASALVLLVLLASPAGAAPRADLWERWARHDPGSTLDTDHSAWSALLSRYVREDGQGIHRFDYAGVSDDDRAALTAYLDQLQRAPVDRMRRDAQRALWINLYNALTVKVVLDHYPVASIRDIDISPGLFSSGPWGAKLLRIAGESLSLDDIEHRILRPIWRDPRVHYAVNCASVGCPDLMREAFTAANTERLLDTAARRYVNHARGVSLNGDTLVVSSIYAWFAEDFGGSDAGVIAHLRRHADPPLAARLAAITRIADDRYDWSLNDAR